MKPVLFLAVLTLSAAGLSRTAAAAQASVDLGSADASAGLVNSQRGQNTDGENDPATCGPASDLREGRKNRGTADGDFVDLYTYFLVTAPAVKASMELRISASFYDDPAFGASPARVRLQYTNLASTGPSDLANTFFTHPEVLNLQGTGAWIRHTWILADAGFRTFMQGTSDFRFDMGGSRVCIDRVDASTPPPLVAEPEYLIGAHYYPWYSLGRWNYTECVGGSLRLELRPAQPPALGRYDSSSPAVVDRHLRWCAEHGITVLILEFISPGSREDQICRNVIFPHPRGRDVRFTVLYDWAIRFGGAFEATPARIATARGDFLHLAENYFTQPSYLKFRGELPVAMIYVTRALNGDVAGLSAAIREACASRGFEVFLVGDEFFFPSPPDGGKIGRWDGIFGYDVYAGRGGYWGSNGTLDLFRQRTDAYRQAAESRGVLFVPSCAPGFNDRAIRRTCANNPALPRRLRSGEAPASLFRETFKQIALTRADSDFPLVSITSFNEWHEDTQIEPTAGAGGSTAQDTSPSGSAYTQGFEHDDYGLEFLELIRDATIAVTGSILGPNGPVAAARIEALDGNEAIAARASFSTGVYTVSRRLLSSGRTYRLRVSSAGLPSALSPPFTVFADRTLTGFNLALLPKVSRGDCDSDGRMDLSDPIALLSFLFRRGAAPPCLEACDFNGDRGLDLADAVFLLLHLFRGAPPPGFPAFPRCEPMPGALSCGEGNCQE
ncbi:MAG: hypothetical protein HY717_13560 [Planctomycetes bacterium]|nr:hypothetical protein [Planctomycetota bacterium]